MFNVRGGDILEDTSVALELLPTSHWEDAQEPAAPAFTTLQTDHGVSKKLRSLWSSRRCKGEISMQSQHLLCAVMLEPVVKANRGKNNSSYQLPSSATLAARCWS